MQTKIDLCSQALLKIGEKAIAGFEDGSAAAEIARKSYDAVIDGMLCLHPWRFAMKKYALTKTDDGGFPIPADALRVVSCGAARHEIMGNRIFADVPEIEITAVAKCGPESFPPYFSAAATTRLALEFCIPLTGNQNAFAILNALFDNELRIAKFVDSSFGANTSIGGFALIDTRF